MNALSTLLSPCAYLSVPLAITASQTHQPVQFLVMVYIQVSAIFFATFIPTSIPTLFISDVTTEYANTSHTISPNTPGMEMMMEEYIAYKEGTRRDPVANLNGARANLKNYLHFRLGGREQPACGDNLHQQPNLRSDHEGRQDDLHGPVGSDRGHPWPLHRLLHNQWN